MRLIECEKCYRGFLPDDDEIFPIISGRSVAKREDGIGLVCPYCGHKQSEENLVTPL
jgi:DNA-directed RNA polymerase subunit RPC12/RpoP